MPLVQVGWARALARPVMTACVMLWGTTGFVRAQEFVQILGSPNPQSDGLFGWDLDTDGHSLLVGAPDEALGAGRAYIFQRPLGGSPNWDYVTELVSPGTGGKFGQAIEQQDGLFMISGNHSTSTHVGVGLVYCYDLSVPSAPVLTQVLFPSISTSYTEFGNAMASTPRWLAVAARFGNGPSNTISGVVYMFENQQGTWVEKYRVEPSDGAPNDLFGQTVAIDGDRLLVHAHNSRFQGVRTGKAYLYELGDTGATEVQRFDRIHVPPGSQVLETFPNVMHLEGDELVLADFGGGVGIRYALNPNNGQWEWVESSKELRRVSTYPAGNTPEGTYVGGRSSRLHKNGFRTLHRSEGVWESCGKSLMPPAFTASPTYTIGFILEFAGGQAFSGAFLYPLPSPGFHNSPGSVFIWNVDPDFFDAPTDCFVGGRVTCAAKGMSRIAPCPCGNLPADGDAGCENSTGQGGLLRGTGDASYSFEALRLQASQLPPQSPVLFRWAMRSLPISPALAGAGVHCLGQDTFGSALAMSDSLGIATTLNPPLPQPMFGMVGRIVVFQAFYRDGSTGTCPHTMNVTNALSFRLQR